MTYVGKFVIHLLSTVYHDLDIQLVYVFYKLSIHSLSAVYHDLDPLATLGHFERLQSLLQSVAMRNERLHVNLTARQHLNHRGPPTIIIIITELSFITLLLLSSQLFSLPFFINYIHYTLAMGNRLYLKFWQKRQ